MKEIIREEEINDLVKGVLADFNGGKNIDNINIFNKPDKNEIHELVHDMSRIVFPGYFRDRQA